MTITNILTVLVLAWFMIRMVLPLVAWAIVLWTEEPETLCPTCGRSVCERSHGHRIAS